MRSLIIKILVFDKGIGIQTFDVDDCALSIQTAWSRQEQKSLLKSFKRQDTFHKHEYKDV